MMEEVVEVKVSTKLRETQSSETITTPPLEEVSSRDGDGVPKTPKSPFASRLMNTPLASPMKKAIENMQGYFGEVRRFTKLDPQDDWLPITQSRNGNAYYAAFHVLSSGIGFQALLLPFAFTTLGWTWGITCLCVAFTWQLYTLWLLVQLHESESGVRHSRYLRLAMAAFANFDRMSTK
ncbi:Amino acid transporter [Vigna unguiculata]|uniref:Amino acid transporter n=1 Tax=Vigna unguiculata TaxID=3917 RepID=A0A4D6NTG7_VIGUN|nr:Amino acid transporter [Vigna unguiculata]